MGWVKDKGAKAVQKFKKGGKVKRPKDVRHIVKKIDEANRRWDEGMRFREPYYRDTKLTLSEAIDIKEKSKKILKKKK
jgi:hypothetical protein